MLVWLLYKSIILLDMILGEFLSKNILISSDSLKTGRNTDYTDLAFLLARGF